MLTVEGLGLAKSFGEKTVFQNINFKVSQKESLVITGPNGSGKSTLLKIICELLSPTSGKIRISNSGKELSEKNRKSSFGLVSPELELYEELSAVENLVFFSRMKGVSPDRAQILQNLASVGLEKRKNDLIGEFSSGMKQRMKYLLALAGEPEILLLDEPFSNLDSAGIAWVESMIEKQKQEGILIFATNLKEELKYAGYQLKLGD